MQMSGDFAKVRLAIYLAQDHVLRAFNGCRLLIRVSLKKDVRFLTHPTPIPNSEGHKDYEKTVLVITVHGTWAGDRNLESPKWWEDQSQFLNWLRDDLDHTSCTIEEFIWSGANSDKGRTKAAKDLARLLSEPRLSDFDEVHIIAHSHGGNVVEMAIKRLNAFSWKGVFSPGIFLKPPLSVVTVGAPYFRSRVPRFRRVGQIGSLFAVPGFVILGFGAYSTVVNPPFGPGAPSTGTIIAGMVFVSLAAILCFATALLYLRDAFGTVYFRTRRQFSTPRWLAVVHPSDEAVSALRTADLEFLKVFEPRALRRNILSGVFNLGILLFVIAMIGGIILWSYGALAEGMTSDTLMLLFLPAALAGASLPVIWLMIYLLLLPTSSLLAYLGNVIVNGRIQGFAMGQDHCSRLDLVSKTPHSLESDLVVLSGDWHDRMLIAAQAALVSVLGSNHAQFFRTDLSSMLGDIFSRTDPEDVFDGLIHTSYFRHRELASLVAKHQKTIE